MTGHVRQRGPGRWELRVFTGRDPLTGRKKYATKTVDANGIRHAERELARYVTELDGGQALTAGTFGDLLERWYDQNEADWSPNTCQLHRWAIDRRLGGLKPLDVRHMTARDLDRFYKALRTRGGADGQPVAGSTVARIHTIIRSALKQAVDWEWRDDNPAERARPGKTDSAEIHPPDTDVVRRLVETARTVDVGLLLFIVLGAETGARRGELAALRWSDIGPGKVTIGRTLAIGPDTTENRRRYAGHIWPASWHQGRPTALIEKPTPKTQNSRRTITLSVTTVDLIASWRRTSAELALACGVQLPADGFVFAAEVDGSKPLRPLTWSRRFQKLRDVAGVDATVRLHDLRHYVATTLLAAGVDLATVAGRLGHGGGGKTTLAIYGHFLEGGEPDRAAAELLAALTAPPAQVDGDVIPLRPA